MTYDDLIILLTSSRASDRLRAVRRIEKTGNVKALNDLHAARVRETDSWVQSALDRLIHKWKTTGIEAIPSRSWVAEAASDDREEIYAKATQRVTETIIHELSPIVGSLEIAATTELGDEIFTRSSTASKINRIRDLLATVQKLHEASASPIYVEFDLVDCIAKSIEDCGFSDREVLNSRQETVIALGDPDLLSLALVNGIKNAVEASAETKKKVIVNCAATDKGAWVAILDDGVGGSTNWV